MSRVDWQFILRLACAIKYMRECNWNVDELLIAFRCNVETATTLTAVDFNAQEVKNFNIGAGCAEKELVVKVKTEITTAEGRQARVKLFECVFALTDIRLSLFIPLTHKIPPINSFLKSKEARRVSTFAP